MSKSTVKEVKEVKETLPEGVEKVEVKEVKEVKKVKEVKTINITPIINAIPDTFTPALLDKLFNINDGGKTVRRHLRTHFSEQLNHAKKDKWTFTKADNSPILQYFANRYTFDLKNIATKTA